MRPRTEPRRSLPAVPSVDADLGRPRRARVGLALVLAVAGLTACGGNSNGFGGKKTEASGGSDGAGGSLFSEDECVHAKNADEDDDGYTVAEGDCDDCDATVNPGAAEIVDAGNEDENCNGIANEVTCDDDPAFDEIGSLDPMLAAQAVELCTLDAGDDAGGLVSARWSLPDGSDVAEEIDPGPFHLGHGILDGFGPNVGPRAGKHLLAISSGTARRPTDAGFFPASGFNKDYACEHPIGFPKESPACPGVETGRPRDGIGLEVKLRVPKNADGFAFNFNFFTFEWPIYICSEFNDFFVALLDPMPPKQADGNISFDKVGNPVSVNNAFLEVCGCAEGPPCLAADAKNFSCKLGTSTLEENGFGADAPVTEDQTQYDHASTYWLVTKAPAEPGSEITLRWAIYDSGDGAYDSTTLIDNFVWTKGGSTDVGTDQVEPPK